MKTLILFLTMTGAGFSAFALGRGDLVFVDRAQIQCVVKQIQLPPCVPGRIGKCGGVLNTSVGYISSTIDGITNLKATSYDCHTFNTDLDRIARTENPIPFVVVKSTTQQLPDGAIQEITLGLLDNSNVVSLIQFVGSKKL
jgi:hypothetical protein